MNGSLVFSLDRAVAGSRSRERWILLAAALALPLFLHALPAAGPVPLGARLLPLFYAPCLAAALLRPHWALAIAVASPACNWILLQQPGPERLAALALELLLCAALAAAAVRRWPAFFLAAPLACIVAKGVTALALGLVGTTAVADTLAAAGRSVSLAWPGLLVLAALNLAISWRALRGRVP